MASTEGIESALKTYVQQDAERRRRF